MGIVLSKFVPPRFLELRYHKGHIKRVYLDPELDYGTAFLQAARSGHTIRGVTGYRYSYETSKPGGSLTVKYTPLV